MVAMIIIAITIIIALIILAILWLTNSLKPSNPIDPPDQIIPTIHSKCRRDSPCGGDLECDPDQLRCKKQKGGACANDIDCISGLYCNNWICSPDIPTKPNTVLEIKDNQEVSAPKSLKWDDTRNTTRYF